MQYFIRIISAGASLLLIFLVISDLISKVNRLAKIWLSVHISCIFLILIDEFFRHEEIYIMYPHFYGYFPIVVLLLIPSLYLSTIYYIKPYYKFKKSDIFHFSLLIFYLIVNIQFYFASGDIKLQAFKAGSYGADIILLLFFVQAFLYGYIMLKKLRKHKATSVLYSAKEYDIQLDWLRDFIRIILILFLFWFIESFLDSEFLSFAFDSVVLIGIFLAAYFSQKQQGVIPYVKKEKEETIKFIEETIEEEENFIEQTVLTEDEKNTIINSLDKLMVNQKPYLDSELNISRLAGYLETQVYKLSYLLNTHYNKNFSSFINEYRVNEAKELLTNPEMDYYNIIQIGYEAGFGSKTVFNTNFKRLTNLSPTLYRKQVHQKLKN